ncbi:hypothetical protein ET989_11220 [Propioniciclava sinopodophylli]|uniref:Uncharacterized protein n=1 Tax=Propioniciclava sinopodophylli TaxID=1837344 RepID=A0A4Q9KBY3_9ACTN|nr:hypothetical protein ET989_11220 [Propioniciclava sinopodophylli]
MRNPRWLPAPRYPVAQHGTPSGVCATVRNDNSHQGVESRSSPGLGIHGGRQLPGEHRQPPGDPPGGRHHDAPLGWSPPGGWGHAGRRQRLIRRRSSSAASSWSPPSSSFGTPSCWAAICAVSRWTSRSSPPPAAGSSPPAPCSAWLAASGRAPQTLLESESAPPPAGANHVSRCIWLASATASSRIWSYWPFTTVTGQPSPTT